MVEHRHQRSSLTSRVEDLKREFAEFRNPWHFGKTLPRKVIFQTLPCAPRRVWCADYSLDPPPNVDTLLLTMQPNMLRVHTV